MTTTLLAFDTATERVTVALGRGDRSWHAQAAGGAMASATLLPAIAALMEQAAIGYADLDAIAFGRGPGAFTGLRTACSVAQGLALGAGKPVLPVDTLLVVAEDARALAWADEAHARGRADDARARGGAGDARVRRRAGDARVLARAADPAATEHGVAEWRVWAVADARMGEVYAALYGWRGGAWRTLVAPGLGAPEALAARWAAEPADAVAGAAIDAFDALRAGGAALRIGGALASAPALLRLARQAFAVGAAVDAALALPLYVRDKVALTTAERADAAAARAA